MRTPMGRKRKNAKTVAFHMDSTTVIPPITAEEILQEQAATNSATNSVEDNLERQNISFVERDGKIAFDEMRESQKEKLREFVNRPEVQAEFAPKTETKSDDAKFDVDEANALLDFLQPVLAIGASKVYGVPAEITSQAYVFNDNMRAKLSPRMTRLLNKWGPSIFAKYKDEIGCGLILVSCVAVQTKQMKFLAKRANDKKVTQMPSPAPVAVPTPDEEKTAVTGD